MERRKVIRQGKGTLTMSLPSKWIRQVDLKPGDELFVDVKGGQIIVSKSKGKHAKQAVDVDLSGLSKGLVYAVLENLYIRGDDEFRLHFESPDMYEAISDAVRGLLGFEIVENTSRSCVVKELARSESEDFDNVLRRIFLLILTVADDGIDAFRRDDAEALDAIHRRDQSINTLCCFCLRVLNKQEGIDLRNAMHLYALLILFEQLGDCYSRLYRDVKHIQHNTLKIAQRVAVLLRDFYNLFYSFNKSDASMIKEKRDAIRTSIDRLLGDTRSKDDIVALHHLRRIVDLIVDIEKFNLAMQI